MPKPKFISVRCQGKNHKIELHEEGFTLLDHQQDEIDYDLAMREFGEQIPIDKKCIIALLNWKNLMSMSHEKIFYEISNKTSSTSFVPKELLQKAKFRAIVEIAKTVKPQKRKGNVITVIAKSPRKPRLRAREIDIKWFTEYCRSKAVLTKSFVIKIRNGGTVAKSYGYFAETEIAVAISDPIGRVVVWYDRGNAYGISDSSILSKCLSEEPKALVQAISDEFRKTTQQDEKLIKIVIKALHYKVFGRAPRKPRQQE